jgi:hypothetical protein
MACWPTTQPAPANPSSATSTACTVPRRGDYRIVYEILSDPAAGDRTVLIHRIRHRAHVYRTH